MFAKLMMEIRRALSDAHGEASKEKSEKVKKEQLRLLEEERDALRDKLRERIKEENASLTQPENPYYIVKIDWDPELERGGFRVCKDYRYVVSGLDLDYLRYSWCYDEIYVVQVEIDNYKTALENDNFTRTGTMVLQKDLFPTFEIAEAWLQSFIHGPDVARYSTEGVRIFDAPITEREDEADLNGL